MESEVQFITYLSTTHNTPTILRIGNWVIMMACSLPTGSLLGEASVERHCVITRHKVRIDEGKHPKPQWLVGSIWETGWIRKMTWCGEDHDGTWAWYYQIFQMFQREHAFFLMWDLQDLKQWVEPTKYISTNHIWSLIHQLFMTLNINEYKQLILQTVLRSSLSKVTQAPCLCNFVLKTKQVNQKSWLSHISLNVV